MKNKISKKYVKWSHVIASLPLFGIFFVIRDIYYDLIGKLDNLNKIEIFNEGMLFIGFALIVLSIVFAFSGLLYVMMESLFEDSEK